MPEELLDDSTELLDADEPLITPYPTSIARLLAFVLDAWLLGFVLLAGVFLQLYVGFSHEHLFPSLMVVPVYKWWMEARCRGTVGKHLLGMVVVRAENRQALDGWTSFQRNGVLFPLFFGMVLCLYANGYHVYDVDLPLVYDYNTWLVVWADTLRTLTFFYGVGYVLGVLVMLFTRPSKTLYDVWAKTVCVNIGR